MPRPWTLVGFVGNRALEKPGLVRVKIEQALDRIAAREAFPLACISSAAKGADILFAEVVSGRRLPWILLLPFGHEEFFNRADFSPDDLARIEPLVGRAREVRIEPEPARGGLAEERRGEAFRACSARVVDESDYVVAAWNGEPGKAGGTAETIDYARRRRRPLIIIHARTGEMTEENFPAAAGQAPPTRRILSLDGGGIRGVFSLMVLRRVEALCRAERGDPKLVLRDCFDFFAGTSTGAIIAALLAWGKSVEEILRLYRERGREMFTRSSLLARKDSKYAAGPIEKMFRELFGDATLGTRKLWDPADPAGQKVLLVVMRNASTGSAWPVCNHPAVKYNAPGRDDCNLQVPLWQVLRGSTAAPTFFRPQPIALGGRTDLFVDGGMTPYNNPALIAALMATLPAYNIRWPAGPGRLQLVSVGTMTKRTRLEKAAFMNVEVGIVDSIGFAARALLDAAAIEQDLLCRVLGDCVFGAAIDQELGDLRGPGLLGAGEKKFRYVRYNEVLTPDEVAAFEQRCGCKFDLDSLQLIPALIDFGAAYAERHVRREHLFDAAAITRLPHAAERA
ncbi:MAG TPA: patatin-like phospholipase family protein [Opitutaceae bacterium]|nr:patatin-like phospholipase family protein [Opitutaceae bacterium]